MVMRVRGVLIAFDGGDRALENPSDQYLTINQCPIRFRDAGSGPPLLLVHGIAGFLEEWEPAMKALQSKFRVIVPDLLGHGLSGKPDIPYTIENLANFLKAFMAELKLEKVILAGHSLGGAISLYFALQYPHAVEKLILVNSAFTSIPLAIRLGSIGFLPKLIRRLPFRAAKAAARRTFYNHRMIDITWLESSYRYTNEPGTLRVMFSVIRSNMNLLGLRKSLVEHFFQNMNQFTVPTLILYGKKDRIVPNINSKELHKALHHAECIPVENSGHEMQYECCDLFCEQVIRFTGQ